MDQYAGGIATDYQYNEERLVIGKKRIGELLGMIDELKAKDMFELKRYLRSKRETDCVSDFD